MWLDNISCSNDARKFVFVIAKTCDYNRVGIRDSPSEPHFVQNKSHRPCIVTANVNSAR